MEKSNMEKPPSQKTIKDFYLEQFYEKQGRHPGMFDLKLHPYSALKARFFTLMGGILVYFLLNTRVTPNSITITYGLLGFLSGVLLAIPNHYCILTALFIYYFRGILDWTDGLLARNRGETSLSGYFLDAYGGKMGTLTFFVGLGFYVAAKNENSLFFYYLIPIIPTAHALVLTQFGKATLFSVMASKNHFASWIKSNNIQQNSSQEYDETDILKTKFKKSYDLISSYLDDRSRTVDTICLIILLELYFPLNISWVIFFLLVIKWTIVLVASFYVLAKGGWPESNLNYKLSELKELFDKEKTSG